ncbi:MULTISPECIES: hydroxymethylpyrimidine/phosphomethylpyrimidine kinase [unclassified Campylobacter]|uniref:hydroxymethylpyrimidine/phosphomethylpyrimidine kinase n=1 Tax=unclassified Campylobacter TaxID=2593542 RepID=UPI0014763FF8|nr:MULTISPECIES: hydroxymethylpyrimidine/phosphomethylpyrimidine kinase [unclassified Campylobacter]QKG30209.1 hydroxymethylpyrimidine kinase / phosphohydroxymethylpyrimidine kinase [Campylobacter sp. RM16187]
MKKILIIAGSCSNGGAGIQADIKACSHFGCYSATAITALTAENSNKIKNIISLDANFVKDQLDMLSAEFDFDAVKIGMLFNKEIMDVVEKFLHHNKAPVVLDPVCVSKMGHRLIKDSAIEKLKELMRFATVSTPNLREAKVLFGGDFSNLPCDTVVKKHILDNKSIDILYGKDGSVSSFETLLADPLVIIGAGCTFSSSLACLLAQGNSIEDAIKKAKEYIYNAIISGVDTKLGSRKLLNHGAKA